MGSNSNVNERVSNNLIETLIAMNFSTGALEPGLAESWKFVNDKPLFQ
jgi:ABC-type transport system substrate-binding protein